MRCILLILAAGSLALLPACSRSRNDNTNTTATTVIAPPPIQRLSVRSRPDWIVRLLNGPKAAEARPEVRILSPQSDQAVAGKAITVRFNLTGGLEVYPFVCDKVMGVIASGDHLHVILDNQPYQECNSHEPCELHDVPSGKHTLRVIASRPWHESYKNQGAFQMVRFIVGPQAKESEKGSVKEPDQVDPTKPVLTYNTPQGDYNPEAADAAKVIVIHNCGRGEDKSEKADPIMIDFWLSNAKLKGDGGEFRIRYFVDDDDARFIDKLEPIWLEGWTPGKHNVHLELLGKDEWPVKNGAYNVTSREITISK
jgi:hypothetical protein